MSNGPDRLVLRHPRSLDMKIDRVARIECRLDLMGGYTS
jgi:hypothetical protein